MPHEQLICTFKPEIDPDIVNLCAPLHPGPANQPVDTSPFITEEVLLRLKRAANSAPGPDTLTYQHWRGFDSESAIGYYYYLLAITTMLKIVVGLLLLSSTFA